MEKSVIEILRKYAGNKKLPENFYAKNDDEVEMPLKDVDHFFVEGFKLGLKLGFECHK